MGCYFNITFAQQILQDPSLLADTECEDQKNKYTAAPVCSNGHITSPNVYCHLKDHNAEYYEWRFFRLTISGGIFISNQNLSAYT